MIPLDTALLSAMPWILLSSIVEAGALTLLRIGGKWNIIYSAVIFACAVVPLLSKALEWEGCWHGELYLECLQYIFNVFNRIYLF